MSLIYYFISHCLPGYIFGLIMKLIGLFQSGLKCISECKIQNLFSLISIAGDANKFWTRTPFWKKYFSHCCIHTKSNWSGNHFSKLSSEVLRIIHLGQFFRFSNMAFSCKEECSCQSFLLLQYKYALQLLLVTPIICNVGSLALNQFKKLQNLNTYIIIMMTEKAMNVLQLHLLSLLRKKKLITCSCQPWRPRPI